MAKTQSFGDKVKKDSNEEKFTTIKYIRSVISEKTGKNRFVEAIYKIPASESMDSFLKKVDNPEEELKVDEIKVDKVKEVKEGSTDVQSDVKSSKEDEVNADGESVEVKPDLEKPANSNELNKSEEKPLDDKKESKEEAKK